MSDEAERLFERALLLEPEARGAFLEDACGANAELHEELKSLLAQAEAADRFFGHLTEAVASTSFSSAGEERGPGPPSDAELPAGEVVAQYRILSLLGRGGMGTVYRAHDTRLDRDVALKFLPSDLGAQPDAEERLLAEARAAAALEHPNVCAIYEIGETADGRRFIAMAYYEGETLRERLRRGALSLEDSVATVAQIARGLAAAHASGIVHRDVKPGNVMLGSDGRVRLLDFGLAMTAGAAINRSGITPGTIGYMSPEQARSEAVDSRTDLWSLGVVFYEMLAGSRPFQGNNAAELLRAILHSDPAPIQNRLPGLPDPIARIVERLLQRDPASRYGRAADVVTDLSRAVPVAVAAPGSTLTKRRAALLAGGTTLLLVLTVLIWSRGGGERSRAAEPSIAVLPLVNLSDDPRDAALAVGLTEELIATLAKAGDVRVIASTSTAGFRDRKLEVRQIAESLGVSNILEGGIQKVGSQLRVSLRLVTARDGTTRWSQVYDREFKDVFSVQEEIVRAVAGELELRFDRDRQLRRHQTRTIAAYELYLRGSDPLLLRSESGMWKALEYFQQAIVADSSYAAAHAGLALVYVRRIRTFDDPGMPVDQLFALAEGAAEKAVALDDSLPEAHYSLGRVREAMLAFPSAETELRRAIALDPTRSIYHRSLATLHGWAGRPEDELLESRRALETDPLNPYAIVSLASSFAANRRFDLSLAQLQRVAAIKPPLQAVAFVTAQVYFQQKRLPEAIAVLRPQAEAGDPLFRGLLGFMLARAGQRAEANRMLVDLLARRERTGVGAFQVAMVHAGLGELDSTFAWLDRSIDDRSISSMIMGLTFEHLRTDPRFQRMRERLGLLNRL